LTMAPHDPARCPGIAKEPSPVTSPKSAPMTGTATADERRRTYALSGLFNFRDIGGYATADGGQTRWGRVFRSDSVHRLTQADLEQVRPLGIRTLLDLRSGREIEEAGPGLIHSEPGIEVVHIPFGRIGEEAAPEWQQLTLAQLYTGIVREAAESLARVMTTLAATDQPAVVHCAAGKDRTGMSIALLLRLLGVPDETVMQDYLLTGSNFAELLERMPPETLARLGEFPEELMRVDATVMSATLAIIDDEFGSTEAFLIEYGASAEHIARLRDRLVV
jgi:protein-tyrosine phosphatase